MRVRLAHLFLALQTSFLLACGGDAIDVVRAPRDFASIDHGRELVTGLAACGRCHGQLASPESPLSGGQNVYDVYGALSAPNITPSQSGIGQLSDQKILGTLRGLWGDEAKHRSPDVHRGYEWMADRDALAIVGYLRSLPPVKNQVDRRDIGFVDPNTTGIFEAHSAVTGYVPQPSHRNQVLYGRYLVDNVARCGACHTTAGSVLVSPVYLGGGTLRNHDGTFNAPALIGSRETMSYWGEPEIVNYFRSGQRPDGSFVDPRGCPTPFYKNAAEQDLQAIAVYIRSLS